MRVTFRYQTLDRDDVPYELLVKADVDLGTPAILDRRPEHCEPGESASAELDVYLDDSDRTLTEAETDERFGVGTWREIVAAAIAEARSEI